MTQLTCFKAHDLRSPLGAELNEDIAHRIGRADAQFLEARKVVIGGDMPRSLDPLKQAFTNGLMDAGCDVSGLA